MEHIKCFSLNNFRLIYYTQLVHWLVCDIQWTLTNIARHFLQQVYKFLQHASKFYVLTPKFFFQFRSLFLLFLQFSLPMCFSFSSPLLRLRFLCSVRLFYWCTSYTLPLPSLIFHRNFTEYFFFRSHSPSHIWKSQTAAFTDVHRPQPRLS